MEIILTELNFFRIPAAVFHGIIVQPVLSEANVSQSVHQLCYYLALSA
jgi:hypothetical protein